MSADPHDLSALIAALQEATVGSRELDERIALASGYKRSRLGIGGGFDWVAPDRTLSVLPEFSTSLDASLRLVPIGMQWEVSTSSFHDGTDAFQAYVYDYGSDGHTPALAMCCAALRARSAG